MPIRRKFLIIDDNADGRFLFAKTLLRKYPDAIVLECQELEAALKHVRSVPRDNTSTVVIAHRAGEADGLTIVTELRRIHAKVPIVWISEIDRMEEAHRAGANRFLNYEAWLMIGSVVEDLAPERPKAPRTARVAPEPERRH